MSERDRLMLAELGLTQEVVGQALQVTRQAVSKGVERSSHYLGVDRLRALIAHLKLDNPGKAERLYKLVRDYLTPSELAALQSARISVLADNPSQTESFRQLWVFSPNPHELEYPGYFEQMLNKHLTDPNKTIEYFLADEAAKEFAGLLGGSLSKYSKKHARITVHACGELLKMAPHYIVLEPLDPDLREGWVLTEGSQFARLSDIHTRNIVVQADRMRRSNHFELLFTSGDSGGERR